MAAAKLARNAFCNDGSTKGMVIMPNGNAVVVDGVVVES